MQGTIGILGKCGDGAAERSDSHRRDRVGIHVGRNTRRPLGHRSSQGAVIRRLLADAEFLNNVFVSFGVVFLEVIKQATPLADQH